jgi:hypothetical protein
MVATRRPALLACAAAACLILVVVAPGAAADTQQFQIFPALRNAFFSSYVAARSSPAPKAQAGSTAAASAGGEKGCVKVETRDLTKAEGQSTFLYVFAGESTKSPPLRAGWNWVTSRAIHLPIMPVNALGVLCPLPCI